MQYDNIYMFKIFYCDKNGKDAFYKNYSDKKSVFALKNLPDTTYKIERRHLEKDYDGDDYEEFYDEPDKFWVGRIQTLEDLENEIKTVTDKKYRNSLKERYDSIIHDITRDIAYEDNDRNTLILRLNDNRIIFAANTDPEKVIGVIEGGKIVRQKSQTAQTQQPAKREYDNYNYTDLE